MNDLINTADESGKKKVSSACRRVNKQSEDNRNSKLKEKRKLEIVQKKTKGSRNKLRTSQDRKEVLIISDSDSGSDAEVSIQRFDELRVRKGTLDTSKEAIHNNNVNVSSKTNTTVDDNAPCKKTAIKYIISKADEGGKKETSSAHRSVNKRREDYINSKVKEASKPEISQKKNKDRRDKFRTSQVRREVLLISDTESEDNGNVSIQRFDKLGVRKGTLDTSEEANHNSIFKESSDTGTTVNGRTTFKKTALKESISSADESGMTKTSRANQSVNTQSKDFENSRNQLRTSQDRKEERQETGKEKSGSSEQGEASGDRKHVQTRSTGQSGRERCRSTTRTTRNTSATSRKFPGHIHRDSGNSRPVISVNRGTSTRLKGNIVNTLAARKKPICDKKDVGKEGEISDHSFANGMPSPRQISRQDHTKLVSAMLKSNKLEEVVSADRKVFMLSDNSRGVKEDTQQYFAGEEKMTKQRQTKQKRNKANSPDIFVVTKVSDNDNEREASRKRSTNVKEDMVTEGDDGREITVAPSDNSNYRQFTNYKGNTVNGNDDENEKLPDLRQEGQVCFDNSYKQDYNQHEKTTKRHRDESSESDEKCSTYSYLDEDDPFYKENVTKATEMIRQNYVLRVCKTKKARMSLSFKEQSKRNRSPARTSPKDKSPIRSKKQNNNDIQRSPSQKQGTGKSDVVIAISDSNSESNAELSTEEFDELKFKEGTSEIRKTPGSPHVSGHRFKVLLERSPKPDNIAQELSDSVSVSHLSADVCKNLLKTIPKVGLSSDLDTNLENGYKLDINFDKSGLSKGFNKGNTDTDNEITCLKDKQMKEKNRDVLTTEEYYPKDNSLSSDRKSDFEINTGKSGEKEIRNVDQRANKKDKEDNHCNLKKENCPGINQKQNKEKVGTSKESTAERPGTSKEKSKTRKHEFADVVDRQAKKRSSRQIKKLERLLKQIRDQIEKVRLWEMDLEDLDSEDSAYLLEDKLQRKFVKVWDKLCKLHNATTMTGRPSERYFRYQDGVGEKEEEKNNTKIKEDPQHVFNSCGASIEGSRKKDILNLDQISAGDFTSEHNITIVTDDEEEDEDVADHL